jgi:hypothetical protein
MEQQINRPDSSPKNSWSIPSVIIVIILMGVILGGVSYWRSNSQPTRVTEDENLALDWITYINSQYSFSFKHPPGRDFSEAGFLGNKLAYIVTEPDRDFQIHITENNFGSVEDWVPLNIYDNSVAAGAEVKDVEMGGFPAREVYTCAEGGFIETYVLHKEFAFEFRTKGQCKDVNNETLYREMIATFEFIK